ncbi:MAG: cytochrome c biogenesis protein CcsA [SAR324 cluster bacterium]|jgi:heme exporter protein C|nr:cytochrome C assembly protein [Deltaproteobacteria bacterium]MDP6307330.1 cytochrome c biogenesis protein CcsA [SAR324 cluster bacterium]MDP7170526.1 cytochrome c biogenesis protein CcsA [SAR324 cluster bacterium]MDP7439544.1 cytochrome c biogenesis protein CcsA [SAR324 cluster bacterium]MDP7614299.1 cytochrome c biogenesis protein CcsA [SAR324 cluster bacterium]|tara:strand:+ start:1731 stop:2429 length:699 start_codon:yes stop_codon:yes gene_type:complete
MGNMKKIILYLEWSSILGLLACGLWVFLKLPIETSQGFPQKIMYLHVPSVITTYLAFFIVFVYSIAYLWKRELMFDQIAKASAEVGLVFCALVLITGAIWGRTTWGTYWVWDARLTTTLLLFLIFMGYFLLRMSVNDRDKEARLASVLGIIGFLDIPIIHKSVEWWRTLHQPSTLFKVDSGEAKPSMPPELLYPLLASTLVMLAFYLYLLLLRYQTENSTDRLNQLLAETQN